MAVTKVHGGIVTDQMLAGSLKHFKITGAAFGVTVSDGTVNLNVTTTGGEIPATTYFVVSDGQPVPGSAVDRVLNVISEKCTIVQIGLDSPDATTEIHIAVENTSIGWIDENNDIDTVAMQTAIRALGTISVPGKTSGDPSATPVVEDIDLSAVEVVEATYLLA